MLLFTREPTIWRTDPKLMYVPDTEEGRRHTFGALLLEASIHTTNALVVAEEAQSIPVSDDPYILSVARASNFS